jgi:ParB-like chromosome segregation protein Spo0J
MTQKIKIELVKIEKDLYPRTELDQESVNQYREAIEKLPPIVVTKDYILIDGYHRLTAHKLEKLDEIDAEILDISDKKEILLEAIRRNTTHGKQLSRDEKKHWAQQLFIQEYPKELIAKELSVSDKSVSRWVKNLEEEKDDRVLELIKNLYLRCYSENEIVDELARQGINLESDNPDPEKRKESARIAVLRKIKDVQNRHLSNLYTPDDLQLYNVWKVFQMPDTQMKYPGQIPEQIIENLLWYYSKTSDIVLDPMAGSGVVGKVCQRMFRRYWLIDLKPINPLEIKQGDSMVEIKMPEQKKADFVFFDPPYFTLMKSDYPDNGFTQDYPTFLKSMEKVIYNFSKAMSQDAIATIILKPMNQELTSGDWLDMSYDTVEISKDVGLKYIKRISAPLSTQQFTGSNVVKAKDDKQMMNTLRDIIVFKKE